MDHRALAVYILNKVFYLYVPVKMGNNQFQRNNQRPLDLTKSRHVQNTGRKNHLTILCLRLPRMDQRGSITATKELLLVKQYRHGLGIDTVGLPSGTVDPGETPREAVIRELFEETGYFGEDYTLTGKVSANPANHSNLTHCFLVQDIQLDTNAEIDSEEDLEAFFVPIDEVLDMIHRGEFIQSLHIASLLFSFRHLGMI